MVESSFGQSSEVSWQLDSITMSATLVMPPGAGPFAGVVMVAGSGPTDRDWNSPLLPGTNGSALLIAQALARAGIASLRFDKRASGPHAVDNARALFGTFSLQSHVDEVSAAVNALARQEAVRADRIFAVANSEGTLHALNYQLRHPLIPFAGLVLIAPPGRSVARVARAQLAEQAAQLANGADLLRRYDDVIARFMANEPFEIDPTLPEGLLNLLRGVTAPANQPLARELWASDAASLLPHLETPTLIVIGKKDIQVDWQADGDPLQQAATGRQNVTFAFPDNANHVLKYEPLPRSELVAAQVLAGYNAADARLDPAGIETVVDWLTQRSPTNAA